MKIIADIGGNHNGDVHRLERLVRAVSGVGCWGIKPQIYRHDELYAVQREDVGEIGEHWEFKVHWLPRLRELCDFHGLKLGVSVFYECAIGECADYVDFWKISSFDVLREDLVYGCLDTKKPVFMSAGLCDDRELWDLYRQYTGVRWFHCVSDYPTKVEDAGMARLADGLFTGYSDHTRSPAALNVAWNYGCDYAEVHFDLDGNGYEFEGGHCWLPWELLEAREDIRLMELADRDFEIDDKSVLKADPKDGLRPMMEAR